MLTKICSKCNLEKELTKDNFYFRQKGGWASECRECAIKRHREYNQKNREIINAKNRIYNAKPEVKKHKTEYKKNYRIKNKEILNIKDREYRMSDKNRYGVEWDGKEKVEIDHIKPLILATTEQEVYEFCYYTNLQLLKSKDNIEKGIKYEMEAI